MHLGDWAALSLARKVILLASEVHAEGSECVLVNLLNPLDPDAVVCDVQVVQYVGWVVLSEDFVNIQQAFEDTGFPWVHGRWMEKSVICTLY